MFWWLRRYDLVSTHCAHQSLLPKPPTSRWTFAEVNVVKRTAVHLLLLVLATGNALAAELRITCQAIGGASHTYEETNAFRWQDMERASISATLSGTGWEFSGTAIETSPFGNVGTPQSARYTVSSGNIVLEDARNSNDPRRG
jgi:hypothetical protein